jgi:hypothetical protein
VAETLVAAVVVLLLLAAAGGEGVVRLLFFSGAGAIALGLAAGVPAGVVYHLKLFRELAGQGRAEPGWWWRPTSYHESLSAAARPGIMRWFRAGAAGFLAAIAGCALVLAALLAQ